MKDTLHNTKIQLYVKSFNCTHDMCCLLTLVMVTGVADILAQPWIAKHFYEGIIQGISHEKV